MVFASRSRISFAALFVKVTARMCAGSMPCETSSAARAVITRVFPVPAPARMSSGPSVVRTARSCSGLRSKREKPDMERAKDAATLRARKGVLGKVSAQAFSLVQLNFTADAVFITSL